MKLKVGAIQINQNLTKRELFNFRNKFQKLPYIFLFQIKRGALKG
jgi:hypothetical protein